MDSALEFRRRAEQAERQAAGCIGVTREQFLDVARQWRMMAAQAAAGSRRPARPAG